LLCGTFGCGCGPDSWCDPQAAIPTCYQGLNCERCGDDYTCAPALPANYFADGAPLVNACQCAFPLECGKRCDDSYECAFGETCSARGTCAPAGACETNADCDDEQDCVLAQTDVLNATSADVRLVGQC